MTNFSSIDASDVDAFLAQCIQQRFGAGVTIVQQGALSNTIYFILAGTVAVIRHDGDHEIQLAELGKGDFFGEMALVDPNNRRFAEIRTRSACDLACLTYEDFETLAMKQPKLLIVLVSQLINRLKQSHFKYLDLPFIQHCGETAQILMELTKLPDAMRHEHGVEVKVSQNEVAKLTNLPTDMTAKVLDYLSAQNLITQTASTIIIRKKN